MRVVFCCRSFDRLNEGGRWGCGAGAQRSRGHPPFPLGYRVSSTVTMQVHVYMYMYEPKNPILISKSKRQLASFSPPKPLSVLKERGPFLFLFILFVRRHGLSVWFWWKWRWEWGSWGRAWLYSWRDPWGETITPIITFHSMICVSPPSNRDIILEYSRPTFHLANTTSSNLCLSHILSATTISWNILTILKTPQERNGLGQTIAKTCLYPHKFNSMTAIIS